MRTIIIVIAVLAVVAFLYFVVIKGNKSNPTTTNSNQTCPGTFVMHSGILNLENTTYSISGGKYYKQVSAGFAGFGGQLPPKEITQDEFNAACKAYLNPNSTATA